MRETTLDASVPALVLVVSNSMGAANRSTSRDSKRERDSEYEEEHEGNVFVGLKFAMILYLAVAVGIAAGWKLYHLFS